MQDIQKQIRNKILMEVFATPFSLVTIFGGSTALIFAWGLKIGGLMFFYGFLATIIGLGWTATRLLFCIDSLQEKAMVELQSAIKREQEKRFNILAYKLRQTPDKRDDTCFATLLDVYKDFQRLVEKQVGISPQLITKVEKNFESCLKLLEKSCDHYHSSQAAPYGKKKNFLEKRQAILQEVEESSELIAEFILSLHQSDNEESQMQIQQLRSDLKSGIESAKKTRQSMIELEYGTQLNYDEYLQQEPKQ